MSRKPHVAREHELEAQPGLPERLPEGEHILWQGSPQWQRLARTAFHADKIAVYFGIVLVWRALTVWYDGGDALAIGRALLWLAPVFAIGLGLVLMLAWLSARSTLYTLTDRRIVMRIGIVLTVAFNLPLKRIDGATLQPLRDGVGDVALTLESETRIAWLQLWPHVRPWQLKRPQPMLRALPDADAVARRLTQAWVAVNGPTAAVPQDALATGARPLPGQGSGPRLATR